MANLKNTSINDAQFRLPIGDTATRPGSPNARQIRFNTETGKLEQFRPGAGAWIAPSNSGVIATGGDSVYDVDVEGTTYRVHVFTSTGTSTFSVLQGGEVEYLIVAGGGNGGDNTNTSTGTSSGAGGAGGLLTGTATVDAQTYSVETGAGGLGNDGNLNDGAASGDNGGDSSAFGLIAIGGGGGGSRRTAAKIGGSGGAAGYGNGGVGNSQSVGASGTPGQGNKGGNHSSQFASSAPYASGGGGGAGAPGEDAPSLSVAGAGGIGIASQITGISTFYAGGGGGSLGDNNGGGWQEGGLGGGGRGGSETDGFDAVPSTGGGGGGGGSTGFIGGAGGSGIVIIRYPLRQNNPETAAGQDVRSGLVLDLDFAKPTVYNGSGSVVTDSRLNGLEGDLVNGPEFVNPRTHRSTFTFNASNQYITGSQNNINLGENLTITGWFNSQHNTNTNRTVVSIGNRADTPGVHWIFLPRTGLSPYGSISYLYRENGANGRGLTSSEDNLVDGNYHWFAYVIQPTGIRCFIDGSLSTSNSDSQSNYVFTNKIFHVAADGVGGQVFDGGISYIRVYDRALLDSEAINLFNATRWRFGV